MILKKVMSSDSGLIGENHYLLCS